MNRWNNKLAHQKDETKQESKKKKNQLNTKMFVENFLAVATAEAMMFRSI